MCAVIESWNMQIRDIVNHQHLFFCFQIIPAETKELLINGPTGTNVMDLQIALLRPRSDNLKSVHEIYHITISLTTHVWLIFSFVSFFVMEPGAVRHCHV